MTYLKIFKLVLLKLLIVASFCLSSCESEADRISRISLEAELFKQELAQEEASRIQKLVDIEGAEKRVQEEKAKAEKLAAETKKREEKAKAEKLAAEEKEKRDKERYEKYIKNQLPNGYQPFASCFGANKSCSEYGCSTIEVITPSSSDVIVTVKKNSKVYRHVYIRKGSSSQVDMPNGMYQVFFSYGKGWDPEKTTPIKNCSKKGWFVEDKGVSKDDFQNYNNTIITFTLQLVENGNFSTTPSTVGEAF